MDGERRPALLIVDMISDFAFPDGRRLYRNTLPAAKKIAVLKKRLETGGVPAIYVNDNFNKWHDSFATTIESVERSSEAGREMVDILRPTERDYYVLKPDRSGFYETPLGVLLDALKITNLVITGVTTDICVLFTANDAYMRGFGVAVPADCCAAVRETWHTQALDLMKRTVEADVRRSMSIARGFTKT